MNTNDKQIRALREEARAAGDHALATICDVAIASREDSNDDGTPLVDDDGAPLTRTLAREICARVIADAAAQE